MVSPDRGNPSLQLELDNDLITNANALSLLDASDDLLSPSLMATTGKSGSRLDDDARRSCRGLLLSPADCTSDSSSVTTPTPPSDAAWPIYQPGPLKVNSVLSVEREVNRAMLPLRGTRCYSNQ